MGQLKTCPECGAVIAEGDGHCPRCMLRAGLGEESRVGAQRHAFEGYRNLLFGVFAVQLRKVTPQEVMAAAGAWAADATKDLTTRLKEQSILSQTDVEFIARLVDEAVRAHGGDIEATLNTLGGAQVLQATFGNSIDLSRHRYGAAGSPVYLDGTIDPDSVPGVQETPGRYTHVSEHARGGMGRVLLVHDGFLGRNVALKELMPGQKPTSDPENPSTPVRQYMGFLSRFLQEARITGQLEHPSIVPVYELGHRQDGTLYYTMKLVRGKTLREAITQSKTIQERLALLAHFVDLCQAIAYAHSRGIVHRDIKPDNVMVGEFGETVVLDWGLAKSKDREDCHADGLAETIRMLQLGDVDSALKTQYGQVMGTPGYMSPEQALGRITEVDEKSDVYSLGAVLYQMLAGRPPFTGKSVPEILQKVVDDDPEPLDATTVPPELAAICMKAMAKRAEDRYPSASAMAEEVRRFQTGAIVQAYSYGFGHHLKRFAAKHKAVLSTAAAALLAIITLAIYSYFNIRQAKDVAERLFYDSSIAYAYEAIGNHRLYDAQRSLVAAPEQYRNWEWGLIMALSHPESLTLDEAPGVVQYADFSEDGRRILTGGVKGPIILWDADDGKVIHRFDFGEANLTSVDISADGRLAAAADREGRISIWTADSERTIRELQASKRPVLQVILDVSGNYVAAASEDGGCYLWNVSSGEPLAQLDTGAPVTNTATFSPDSRFLATGSIDGSLVIWSVPSGREVRRIEAHDAKIHFAQFAPVGNRIVSTDVNDIVRVWNAESGALLREFEGQWSGVFTPDGNHILTNDVKTGEVLTWSVLSGENIQKSDWLPDISQINANFVTRHLIAPQPDGAAEILSLDSRRDVVTLRGHNDNATKAAFSPDSTLIATSAGQWLKRNDGRAIVWDVETGRIVRILDGDHGSVNSVCFMPDGKGLLSGGADGRVILWNLESGRKIRTFRTDSYTKDLATSPDGNIILTCGWGSVQAWDVTSGRPLVKLLSGMSAESLPNAATYDPFGKFFAVGTRTPEVVVYDSHDYHEVVRFTTTPGSWVTSLAVSNDGKWLAAGDHVITIWNTYTWQRETTVESAARHVKGSVGKLVFFPDSTRLAAGGEIWDTGLWRKLLTLADANAAGLAALSPDGLNLVTSNRSEIGSFVLWRAFPWQLGQLPGNNAMPLSDRLDRVRRAREIAGRKRDAELNQSPACQAQLNNIDAAAIRWAESTSKGAGAAPPTAAELTLAAFPTCPSGGDYHIASVGAFSSCSIHGIPEIDSRELIEAYENAAAAGAAKAAEIHKKRLFTALPLDSWELAELSNELLSDDEPTVHAAFAIADYAASLAPDEGRVLGTLAYASYRVGRLDDAISTYRTVLRMGETSFSCGLALALLTRGTDADRTEARRLLDDAIEAGLDEKHFVDEVLQVLRDMTPAWNLDAWQDDFTRADLIRLAFFQGPDSVEHRMNPVPDEMNSTLAELENLANGWNDLTSASGRALRGIPEQGIVCDEPVSISKISLDKGDIIVTVGYERVRSLEGLAAHVSEFVATVRADRENTHRLEVSAVNAGGFTRHEIEFPAVVEQSVSFKRAQFALYCKIMANGTRRGLDEAAALEEGESVLSKTDSAPLGLEGGDVLIEWDGSKIVNPKSLIEQLESHEQSAKDGTLSETVLTVRRPSTGNYIRQTIRLE